MDDNSGLTLFPSLFIPLGGKNEGMGTAFTAVANDISFIESNPAGSSLLPKTELAFLHHSWIMDSNIEGVTYVTRLDNLGLAAAGKFLYVPFNEKDGWGQAGGKGYYIEAIVTANLSYNLFKSYYFDGLALGINVKGAYMGIPESIYPDQSYITAMVDVGILTRFNLFKFYNANDKNFSIGATFKNFSPIPSDDPLPTTDRRYVQEFLAHSFGRSPAHHRFIRPRLRSAPPPAVGRRFQSACQFQPFIPGGTVLFRLRLYIGVFPLHLAPGRR
jgi:hypothetical protein